MARGIPSKAFEHDAPFAVVKAARRVGFSGAAGTMAAGHCVCILDRMFQRGWRDYWPRFA